MMKRGIVALAVAVLAAAPSTAKLPSAGEMAPPFTLELINGTKITSDSLRGKVVVLNYWATWCAPCREELPLLDRYYELQEHTGLRVFAAMTEGSLPIYQMKKVFALMHIPPVRKMKGPYGQVTAVPMNYVIDRTGRIRYAKAGAFTLDDLNATLVPLLQEPAPAGTTAN